MLGAGFAGLSVVWHLLKVPFFCLFQIHVFLAIVNLCIICYVFLSDVFFSLPLIKVGLWAQTLVHRTLRWMEWSEVVKRLTYSFRVFQVMEWNNYGWELKPLHTLCNSLHCVHYHCDFQTMEWNLSQFHFKPLHYLALHSISSETPNPKHSLKFVSQMKFSVTNCIFFFFFWKLILQHSPKELNLRIDIYDEVGIGGGASGISGGLLHPYSPKGFSIHLLFVLCYAYFSCGIYWWVNVNVVKLLWEGAQCWKESIKLLRIAEEASVFNDCKIGESAEAMKAFVAHKRFFFSLFYFQKLKTAIPSPFSLKFYFCSYICVLLWFCILHYPLDS